MQRESYYNALYIPYSSHRLQLLDVTFFWSFKKGPYNRECDLYLKSRNLVKISPYDVAELFKNAYEKIASIDKSINGFRATDIGLINLNIFSDEDFFVTDTAVTDVVEGSQTKKICRLVFRLHRTPVLRFRDLEVKNI